MSNPGSAPRSGRCCCPGRRRSLPGRRPRRPVRSIFLCPGPAHRSRCPLRRWDADTSTSLGCCCCRWHKDSRRAPRPRPGGRKAAPPGPPAIYASSSAMADVSVLFACAHLRIRPQSLMPALLMVSITFDCEMRYTMMGGIIIRTVAAMALPARASPPLTTWERT